MKAIMMTVGFLIALTAPIKASELGKKVCAERKANKPAWQKQHYAFAITENGEHCGWAYGHDAVKYAIPAAIRFCKQNASMQEKKTCKVVYAK